MSLYPNAFRGGPKGDCYGGNHYCAKHEQSVTECENDVLRDRTRALEAALETAANRLDIAASVIRSGAEFARWAAEARAVPLWRAGDE